MSEITRVEFNDYIAQTPTFSILIFNREETAKSKRWDFMRNASCDGSRTTELLTTFTLKNGALSVEEYDTKPQPLLSWTGFFSLERTRFDPLTIRNIILRRLDYHGDIVTDVAQYMKYSAEFMIPQVYSNYLDCIDSLLKTCTEEEREFLTRLLLNLS